MFSSAQLAPLLDSSPGDQLAASEALLRRLASLEAAYRPYLRRERCSALAVAQWTSSMSRACEAYLNGGSQVEQPASKRLNPLQYLS